MGLVLILRATTLVQPVTAKHSALELKTTLVKTPKLKLHNFAILNTIPLTGSSVILCLDRHILTEYVKRYHLLAITYCFLREFIRKINAYAICTFHPHWSYVYVPKKQLS